MYHVAMVGRGESEEGVERAGLGFQSKREIEQIWGLFYSINTASLDVPND